MNNLNLKIEYIELTKIKPYENNPRKNDKAVKPLMESIKEFGFSFPITIDKNGVIISGHTRYKAAKKLKLKTIPCVRREDLTQEQETALRLVDNQIASISEWDYPLREEEFAKVGDIDLSCLGFDINASTYIDELLQTEFAPQNRDTSEFEMTLLFPKSYKSKIDAFIAEHGKQSIVDNVLNMILTGGH